MLSPNSVITSYSIHYTKLYEAYTTFSTYAFESTALLRDGQWLAASLNIGGQVVLGIVAVTIGLNLARAL